MGLVHLSVACAVIERAGCVLAAQRAPGRPRSGAWELPGGKIDAAESAEAAVVREIGEELGCTVRALERLGRRTHTYTDLTVTLMPIRCEIVAGEPAALEHAAIRWVPIEELASLDWSAADVAVIGDYIAGRFGSEGANTKVDRAGTAEPREVPALAHPARCGS
ncbi:MAG TPA: (deoxy)nucleoside triphosphate pyrophosphohydrolase [Pseudomonadales bacterium]|nr:(deoxy)nucleoside triphosphate pyrophosphohydrolase [Pseudomonadales bacterium]